MGDYTNKNIKEGNGLLTKQQLAKEFQVSIGAIDKWIKQGKIMYAKFGRSVRFSREHINVFIESRTIPLRKKGSTNDELGKINRHK